MTIEGLAKKQRRSFDDHQAARFLPSTDLDADFLDLQINIPAWEVWLRFRRNQAAVFSLVLMALLLAAATLAPFLHTINPATTDYGSLDQAPSWRHWLGTNGVGSDQYSRLLYGLRIPFVVSITGAAVTTTLGTLIGVLAGYHGGWIDTLLSRLTDVVFAFPGFLLALVIASFFGHALDGYFGGGGRALLLVLVFALVGWPGLMRLVRALTLTLREQQFVEAAQVCGGSSRKIITGHLLPNIWGAIAVQASFIVINFIGVESALSLFGLGVQSPNPDLGVMLFDGKDVMALNIWELLTPAVTLITIIVAGTFIGDGLRDAFDPRG